MVGLSGCTYVASLIQPVKMQTVGSLLRQKQDHQLHLICEHIWMLLQKDFGKVIIKRLFDVKVIKLQSRGCNVSSSWSGRSKENNLKMPEIVYSITINFFIFEGCTYAGFLRDLHS